MDVKIHGFLGVGLAPKKGPPFYWGPFSFSSGDDILVREALGPEDITKMLCILEVRQVVRSALRSVMGNLRENPTNPK